MAEQEGQEEKKKREEKLIKTNIGLCCGCCYASEDDEEPEKKDIKIDNWKDLSDPHADDGVAETTLANAKVAAEKAKKALEENSDSENSSKPKSPAESSENETESKSVDVEDSEGTKTPTRSETENKEDSEKADLKDVKNEEDAETFTEEPKQAKASKTSVMDLFKDTFRFNSKGKGAEKDDKSNNEDKTWKRIRKVESPEKEEESGKAESDKKGDKSDESADTLEDTVNAVSENAEEKEVQADENEPEKPKRKSLMPKFWSKFGCCCCCKTESEEESDEENLEQELNKYYHLDTSSKNVLVYTKAVADRTRKALTSRGNLIPADKEEHRKKYVHNRMGFSPEISIEGLPETDRSSSQISDNLVNLQLEEPDKTKKTGYQLQNAYKDGLQAKDERKKKR
ncbi:hypothetical protein CEXT_200091 [Caerostris extrusa]|uniref:Uncharacterized protein n=1 Tax=Caerostris extrusa TaxID=172846 RepID=A0AAV4YCK3_CAEEX|nr:hypothetical protein CEXT_200091 [Caerostris extrusa]